MTKSEEVTVQIETLKGLRSLAQGMRCGFCCCHDHDGLAEKLEDWLRLLRLKAKTLAKTKDAVS